MIVERNELRKILENQRNGKTVVFTNGVFDIIHPGHVRFLSEAKKLGDILVVGLNTDESVKQFKPGRPINTLKDRLEVVDTLKPVDYVTWFPERLPSETIRILRPDIHVKGGDYRKEDMPETPVVESYGGKVVILGYHKNYSTTRIVEEIKWEKR